MNFTNLKNGISSIQKRSRARTGTEFSLPSSTASDTCTYDFTLVTTTYKPDPLTLSIEDFRVTVTENNNS